MMDVTDWANLDVRREVYLNAKMCEEQLRDQRTLYPHELDEVLVAESQ